MLSSVLKLLELFVLLHITTRGLLSVLSFYSLVLISDSQMLVELLCHPSV